MTQRSTRSAKLDLRLTPEAKRHACRRSRSRPTFGQRIRARKRDAAPEETLADRTRFTLDAER